MAKKKDDVMAGIKQRLKAELKALEAEAKEYAKAVKVEQEGIDVMKKDAAKVGRHFNPSMLRKLSWLEDKAAQAAATAKEELEGRAAAIESYRNPLARR